MDRFADLQNRSDIALGYTAPIYRVHDHHVFELFGSGVFFKHDDQHFVLSVAHVLVELRKHFAVGGDTAAVEIDSPVFHTGSSEDDNSDDSFDVAFAPLTLKQVASLGGARFLTIDDVDFVSNDYRLAHYYPHCQRDAPWPRRWPAGGRRFCHVGC